MSRLYFAYYADDDDDGEVETTTPRYSGIRTPLVSDLGGNRTLRTSRVQTLNGEAFLLMQGRPGMHDQREAGQFSLSWKDADPVLANILEHDFAAGRLVRVHVEPRWRYFEVTSSGKADRKVTVAPGHLYDGGDTYWLDAATAFTCEPSDTKLYVTPAAAGTLSIGGDTSVPSGSYQIATISIAGSIVTVASLSGLSLGKYGVITEMQRTPLTDGGEGLTVVITEILR